MKNAVTGNLTGRLRSHTWPMIALALLTLQAVFAVGMRSSASLSVYSRIAHAGYFLLLVFAAGLAAINAVRSRQAIRLFWFFFALSFTAWAINAWSWIYSVGLSGRTSPDFLTASSSLVLHTAFMIAAVASRPHFLSSRHRPYQTTLDLLVLLFFLLFLYAFLLFPYEYPQRLLSFTRFTAFYFVENVLLIAILGAVLLRVKTPWKSIYGHMFGASVLYALGSLLANFLLMSGNYHANLPRMLYTASACWFVSICLLGREQADELIQTVQIDTVNPRYAATLAMLAVVAIPMLGMWELLRTDQPRAIRVTRLMIVFLALLVLAVTAFVTEYFRKRELSSDTELANRRLHLAMGSGKSAGWEWDLPSGRYLWFGDLRTMFGIEADTFSGGSKEDFYERLHPDDRESVSQEVSDARVNRKPLEAEFRIIRRDGAVRWVAARGSFQYAKSGNPERMLGMAVDITDRKQAEEALRISEQKFSKAFRESPLAFTLTSAKDHRYLDVNETFERISGWRRDEVIGHTPFDIHLWVNPEERLETVRRLQAEGRVSNLEFRFRCKDGSEKLGLVSAELIEISEEPCIVAVTADITERKQIEEKLHDSEERLRQVVDSATDGIIAVDEDQKIVLFNAAAETMFGCTAKDALGSAIDRFVPERFRSQHAAHLRRFGESVTADRAMGRSRALWGMRADGEEFPLEASISRVTDGKKKLFTVIIRDMTERRRIEEERRKSDERLRLAVQAGKMYAYEWDAATDTIIRSPECVDILGSNQPLTTSRRELLAQVHPDDREVLQTLFAKITPENPACDVSYRLIRPDGSLVWMERRARAFFDDQGRLLRTVGVVADVSDRKQAEGALKESEERFRLVANTAPVMIWMAGPDKLCTYFNQPWLQFTGRSLDAELGNGWAENIHPEDRKLCLENYSRTFDQQRAFNMQYRLRRHDGEYRWVLDTGVPRFGPDGSFGGFIGSCIDITERKRAEEALATMGRRLLEAHEEERTWIARELHDDINQQLALVSVEMEQWNQHFPETAADLNTLIQQARNRIFKISKDVQALSHRLHSSKLEYLGIATAAKSFCRELSEQHHVQIKFSHSDVPRGLPPEVSLGLFRVLQEALQNAVKHSHARQVSADLSGTKDEIQLTVVDTGTGFDPTEAMNGRGLGLISMRERLQLVSGTLAIESLPGRGTTIRARVPFKPGDHMSMAG